MSSTAQERATTNAARRRRHVAPWVLLTLAMLTWATWLGFRLLGDMADISLLTATSVPAGTDATAGLFAAVGHVAAYFAAVLVAPILAIAAALLWIGDRVFSVLNRAVHSMSKLVRFNMLFPGHLFRQALKKLRENDALIAARAFKRRVGNTFTHIAK